MTVGLLVLAASAAGGRAADARVAHLTVAPSEKGRPVPRAFLGLSIEYSELGRYEATGADFVRLLDALRPPGDPARVILRVGGESADSTVWGPNSRQWIPPAFRQGHPFQIDQAWMSRLAALVRVARLKVMLDLNLAAHAPKMARVVVAAARRTLPSGSLSDFEIGNEPDLYQDGLVGMTHTKPGGRGQWALSFEPNDYNAWFGNYVSAVRHVDPEAKFAGPEVESKSASWVRSLLYSSRSRDVSLVTVHTYPGYSACSGQGEPPPRARDYLGDGATVGLAHSESPILVPAALAGVSVRVTEVGTAVCGGVAGQSDTFAIALWAPDALFNMLADGIAGVNIHLRANGLPNSALAVTPSGIYPEPLFYGLVMFVRTLGPGAQVVNVSRSAGPVGLKVWIVRRRDRSLRALYINKSKHPVWVRLRFHSKRAASLQRLTAPSIHANQTVKLAGRRLGPDGRWYGNAITQHVPNRNHVYTVYVHAYSATLLGVPHP